MFDHSFSFLALDVNGTKEIPEAYHVQLCPESLSHVGKIGVTDLHLLIKKASPCQRL